MPLEMKTSGAIRCILSPRAELKGLVDMLKRERDRPNGVYILWRNSRGRPLPKVYVGLSGIGEIADLTNRLPWHDNRKNERFGWTHCYVCLGKNRSLTTRRVDYLERRLISLATEANRCDLDNRTNPGIRRRSTNNEQLLDSVLKCLNNFDVDWFSRTATGRVNIQVNRDYHRQGLQILYLEGKGVKARGYISKDQFFVMAGSEAVRRETNALREHNPQVCSLREELRERRVLRSTGKIYRLTNDYPFNSSSQAASFLLGNPFSGPRVWKDSSGRLLRDIQ